MWRWSHAYDQAKQEKEVFSTYVEVILGFPLTTSNAYSILHVCGGDPWVIYPWRFNE